MTLESAAVAAAPEASEESFVAAGRRHFASARGLAVNGGALMINVLVSAVTGLGYWVVAARIAPPHVVGQASAATSAIVAVVSLAQQGFVLTLPSLLSTSADPRRLAKQMYGAALAITAVTAPVYVLLGPVLAGGLEFLHDWRLGVAFFLGTMVWSIFSLQDAVLTGLRRGTYVLLENASWGTIRFVLLIVMGLLGVHLGVGLVMITWVVPAFAFVVLVNWFLFRSPRSPLRPARDARAFSRRHLLSFLGAEYLTSVLASAVTLFSGAYVLTTLGAEDAAPLLTAASFVIVVEGALASFAQALSVEASRADGAHDRRRSLIWLTATFLGALSVVAIAVALLAGEQIMGLLGTHYRASGGQALGILMLAVPFRSIGLVSNADNRIRGQGGRNLFQQAVATAVCFALLGSGQLRTVESIAWAMVAMRVSGALVAAAQLRTGRLKLHGH